MNRFSGDYEDTTAEKTMRTKGGNTMTSIQRYAIGTYVRFTNTQLARRYRVVGALARVQSISATSQMTMYRVVLVDEQTRRAVEPMTTYCVMPVEVEVDKS